MGCAEGQTDPCGAHLRLLLVWCDCCRLETLASQQARDDATLTLALTRAETLLLLCALFSVCLKARRWILLSSKHVAALLFLSLKLLNWFVVRVGHAVVEYVFFHDVNLVLISCG